MLLENLFKDITVLEFASVLAGPSVGQFFAELGANVIKIENHLAGGDVTRSWRRGAETRSTTAYFSSVNWGKQSVGIDLRQKEGRELVYKLVEKAAFVISSFRPGSAEKMEMDYTSLRSKNEALIYGSITGYGQKSGRVGYDAIIQAESGFMHLNSDADGTPKKMPVALMDILAAHHLKEAMLLAWISKMQTGKGANVSVSLYEAAIASLANQSANFLVGGSDPQPTGSFHPNIAPYGEILQTRDGKQIILAIGNNEQFRRLCEVLDLHETAISSDYATNEDRLTHRNQLQIILSEAARKVDSSYLLKEARAMHIPVGEIKTVGEALTGQPDDLWLKAATLTGIRTFPLVQSEQLSPPPQLGSHTYEVLNSLAGLNEETYRELNDRNILA